MAFSHILILFCFLLVGVRSQGIKASSPFKAPPSNSNCQHHGTSVLCANDWPENLPIQTTELTIHGANMPTITTAHIQSLPPNLSVLRIYNCQIQQLDSTVFDRLSNYLQELDLANNEIYSIPYTFFNNMRRLKKLVLRNNKIRNLHRSTFSGLTSLESLDLSQNQLTEMPLDLPSQIQELYLAGNPIQRLDSLPLDNLLTLNLCGTQIDEFPSNSQIRSGKLQTLCLGGRNLKSSSTGFKKLPELLELTLIGQTGTPGNDMHSNVLNSLEGCTKLQRLAIEKYQLPSLNVLKNFRDLHSLVLREVYVQENPLASTFRPLQNLQVIDFSNSARLTQQTLLVQEIRQTWYTLTSLSVRNCQLQDLSWYPVQQTGFNSLPSLYTIDISNNPINCSSPNVQQVLCHFMDKATNPNIDPRYYPVPTTPTPIFQVEVAPQPSYFAPHVPGLQNMDQTCDNSLKMDKDCSTFTTIAPLTSTRPTPSTINPNFIFPVTESINQSKELSTAEKWYIVLGVILFLLAIVTVIVIYLYCRKVDEAPANDCEAENEASKAEVKSFKALKEQETSSTVNLVKE